MLNCFSCNSILPGRGLFCKTCGAQFKCKSCNEFLEPDAAVCVMCGEMVGKGELKNNETVAVSQTMNTFEFKETRNERSAKAIFTDSSVDSLKEALSLVVSSYPLGTIVKRQITKQPHINGELFPETEESFNSDNLINITPKQLSQTRDETTQKLKRLFHLENEILTLEIQDIKAAGQKDFGVRLTYLRLLFSKEIDGEEYTLRESLNGTLKEAMGSLDPHVVSWISAATDLSITTEDKSRIRLKADGYTKAQKILNELYNEDVTGDFWTPEKKSKHSSKSSSKSDNSEKSAKSSGNNQKKIKEVDEWISKWQALNLNIDLHGIAKDLSVIDKVLLAIWVINQATGGNIDSTTTYKIEPIIKNLFFSAGKRSNLDRALKDGYKDHLQKTPNGWRITPTGIKRAESLAGITANTPKPKGKK